jgi:hypothetical protein
MKILNANLEMPIWNYFILINPYFMQSIKKTETEISSNILSLESIKSFLRLDLQNTDSDTGLKIIRNFAIKTAEDQSNTRVLPRVISMQIGTSGSYLVNLGYKNISKITKLEMDGKAVDPKSIKIDYLKGQIQDVICTNINIDFECGQTDEAMIPQDIIFAILTHIAFLWENDNFDSAVPSSALRLYDFYRHRSRELRF